MSLPFVSTARCDTVDLHFVTALLSGIKGPALQSVTSRTEAGRHVDLRRLPTH